MNKFFNHYFLKDFEQQASRPVLFQIQFFLLYAFADKTSLYDCIVYVNVCVTLTIYLLSQVYAIIDPILHIILVYRESGVHEVLL